MQLQLHQSQQTIEVADAVFEAVYNEPLIHQVVTAYLAGGRAGTKAQKTKGEVRGGGKKPWRQKGTGRARAGSIRSPLWRGGGVTHAAKPRDFSQKVNRKMYRGAMRSIVAELVRRGDLLVAERFAVEQPKCKALLGQLERFGVSDVLLVTDQVEPNMYLAARNLAAVGVCDVEALNPVTLLSFRKVLMTAPAVRKLEAWLS
ncbi:MAG: 50S ribosomal protein L4 [Gammaproteobacteria bacterium]|nr:50S ribosomal protein L4 [Gammaproteobacteria bacterium]